MRAAARGSPELVAPAQAFNAMLDQIANPMQQVKEESRTARRYELRALSVSRLIRILYNTLDTIVWMAESNDSRAWSTSLSLWLNIFDWPLNQDQEQTH